MTASGPILRLTNNRSGDGQDNDHRTDRIS